MFSKEALLAPLLIGSMVLTTGVHTGIEVVDVVESPPVAAPLVGPQVQVTQFDDSKNLEEVEEVVITGSRIVQSNLAPTTPDSPLESRITNLILEEFGKLYSQLDLLNSIRLNDLEDISNQINLLKEQVNKQAKLFEEKLEVICEDYEGDSDWACIAPEQQ